MGGRDYLELVKLQPKDTARVLGEGSQTQGVGQRSWVECSVQVQHLYLAIIVTCDIIENEGLFVEVG